MTTRSLKLTYEWQQISTGKETLLIQCVSGRFALCENTSKPAADQPWHVFSEVIITPPSSVWVKTFSPGTPLLITDMGER